MLRTRMSPDFFLEEADDWREESRDICYIYIGE